MNNCFCSTLQNGTICRCGSKHKVWYGSSCNSTCSGNQNETCGGIRQNSIYRITDAGMHDIKKDNRKRFRFLSSDSAEKMETNTNLGIKFVI